MEQKTFWTGVDPAIQKLERLHDELQLPQNTHLKNSILAMQLDLRFFKMFFWGLEQWEETKKDLHLGSVMRTMGNELRKTAKEFTQQFTRLDNGGKITNWDLMSSRLLRKIKSFKPQARKSCIVFLSGSSKSKSYHNFRRSVYASEIDDFIGFILENLELLSVKLDVISPLRKQFGFIDGKLKLFRSFVHLVSHWKTKDGRLDKLLLHTRTWANHVSCLACLYWIDEMDESLASTMGTMISDLMQKTMPYTPEVTSLYFHVLTATRYLNCRTKDVHQLAQLPPRYIDFLFENLDEMNNDVEILREGLVFFLSFVIDSPEDSEDGKLIWAQIDAVISKVPYFISSIHFDRTAEGFSLSKTKFSDFFQKIVGVNAEVSKLYALIPLSLQSKSPKTNAIGFLDFLLGNLKKMLEMEAKCVAHVKDHIQTIQEELLSLRPILQQILELQNDSKEIKDLGTRIINLVYYAEYVIHLSSVKDVSVWHRTICLLNAIEEIKQIKIAVKNIEDDHQLFNKKKLAAEMESSDAPQPQATTSKAEDVFVGFKEDARSLIDCLLRGQKDLTIISISGMPGQGKTTLAKRIYNDPSIQHYFYKTVWCYVSKECEAKDLLAKILSDVSNVDVNMGIHDLADRLRKSLKGKRYLIVMDDIWDVNMWSKVQGSFPDDNNGSRILFTSRNHNLASKAKPNSISHPLRLFSRDESWELMKKKIFHSDGCPPEFLEIGKQIAVYCKGLPLAVALITALLGRTEEKLDLWTQVAENLKSHLANEGCMHILELSYKYLPNHLKPCFLYFGAFPRGEYIRARKLKLLWIAEGFIQENEKQCSEDLAKEYLDKLVSQSLVVVTETSSNGGIKTCYVHDLLYDLCIEKAAEENFLQLADGKSVLDECSSSRQKFDHCRLCIGERDRFTEPRPIYTRKELHTSTVRSLLLSIDHMRISNHSYFLGSFKILTVLDLEGLLLGDHFPEAILSIVQIRYLAIWARIKEVPTSIIELWNLETLRIKGAKMHVNLPETLLRIKSLKHVNIDGFCINFADFELEEISTVYNIERLGSPVLYGDSNSEKLLSRLPKLRMLSCYFEEGFHPSKAIRSLSKLETLRIHYQGHGASFNGTNPENFPGFDFPDNLKKLTLSGLKLPWRAMSTIGNMPNLEVLKLGRKACEGAEWDMEDGEFSTLRFLKLCSLDIERINPCSELFPRLEELVVDSCVRLEEIPSCFGYICTLNILKVFWSDKASYSARRILEEQRDMGNDSLKVIVKTGYELVIHGQ